MSTLKTNNLEHLDASSPNITLGIGGGVNISGITTTEQIRVGADNNGTNIYGNSQGIGIGIQTPTQELEVNGAIVARGQANAYSTDGLYIQNKGLGIFDISAWRDGASVSIITFSTDEGLDAAPVERMRLTQTGNLGIGTDSPEAKLEIFGGITKTGGGEEVLRVESSDAANIPACITQGQSDSTLSILSGGLNTGSRRGGQIDFIAGDASSNAGTLIFRTGTGDGGTPQTERMRIDSSGNVGINTASPGAKLDIVGNVNTGLRITDPSGSYCEIVYNDNGSTTSALTIGSDPGNTSVAASDMRFSVDGTERIRILSTGGLTFNGDTAAANALDDYEEGTWTPVFAGSATAGTYTYGTQTGNYTKIGNKVTAWCLLNDITTGSAGSGAMIVNGLPFTAGGGNTTIGSLLLEEFDLTSTSIRGIHVVVANNANNAAFRVTRDGLSDTNIQVTAKVNNNADIKFCVTYMVA